MLDLDAAPDGEGEGEQDEEVRAHRDQERAQAVVLLIKVLNFVFIQYLHIRFKIYRVKVDTFKIYTGKSLYFI